MSDLTTLPASEFKPRVVLPPMPLHPVEWREVQPGEVRGYYTAPNGQETEAAWTPLYGSQLAFLQATPIFEVLYEGTRGPGKTDALLFDFAQHVGKGYGPEWRGVIFRQTFPQLGDIINKSKKWFYKVFPGAKFNASNHTWTFPTGEQLLFRQFQREDDYHNYHGHAYPWIGWEELTNYPDDKCYTVMMSCSRSTVPGMPRCYRATTNPYGPGHNWVKRRFRLPQMRGRVIRDAVGKDGKVEPPRVAVHGYLDENIILLTADPEYKSRIAAAARNPNELKAWLDGSWDITAGGMFDDIWDSSQHIVPAVPLYKIPKTWKLDRAFDWGSSKPFSVGWYAESNGEPFEYGGRWYGKVRGDLYRVAEWYGCVNGARNEGLRMLAKDVGQGIVDREDDWGIAGRVKAGPADAAIFDEENGNNIARDMRDAGAKFQAADKSPGSRKQGWEIVRRALKNALLPETGTRESPGLFFFNTCHQALELIPTTPRDEKDPDDVDTDAEDHIADELRYRVRKKVRAATSE